MDFWEYTSRTEMTEAYCKWKRELCATYAKNKSSKDSLTCEVTSVLYGNVTVEGLCYARDYLRAGCTALKLQGRYIERAPYAVGLELVEECLLAEGYLEKRNES